MIRCRRKAESALRRAGLVLLVCGLSWLGKASADGVVSVNQPWAKPGVRASEAYMTVTSSEGGTLIGARSPLAGRIELLSASRPAEALPLPAGASLVFRPKGNRLALSRLRQPLKLGGRVPLTLIIENAAGARQEIEVDAEVRRESPVDAELRAHRH